MPVAGSTAIASCQKRPIPVIGVAFDTPSCGTSKMYPCGFVVAGFRFGSSSVSSQESHEPHGVGPPAQFTRVPDRLGVTLTTFPAFGSNSVVVVPPPQVASYGRLPNAFVI